MQPDDNGHGINDPRSAQAYLDEISAQPAKRPFLSKKMMIIVGGILAVALIVVIVAVSIASNSNGGLQQRITALDAEYTTILGMTDYGNKNLPNGRLLRTNAEATLIFSTQSVKLSNYAATPTKKSSGGLSKKAPTELDTLTATFDSAKSSGRLNEIFLDTLSDKIDSLIKGLDGILLTNPSTEIKDLATSYIAQLQEIKNRL